MSDATEAPRRARIAELAAEPNSREALEARYGRVYTTDELSAEFVVEGFMAPFVVVSRLSDGVRGSMEFAGRPRFYFNFVPHPVK